MSNFGDFLYGLRKEKGITQAELAELLGVTNKAVSKWETGEAMPETGLLLPLSRIFGVTVDELLDGKRGEPREENPTVKEHLFTRGKEEPANSLAEKIGGAVCAAIIFAGILVYFLIGIFQGTWHPYWVLIPASAFLCGIAGIIFELCNPKKRKVKSSRGENPYTGAVCGIIMLTCLITFFLLGAFLDLWHPMWIILIAGAFLCAFVSMLIEILTHRK